ncbi:MAG: DUF6324 family protein [Pseudomonadota bacterium]
MGINSESDVSATLTIGPTSEGMVRVYVEADGVEVPMDFFPEEALEIAEELRQAAAAAEAGGRRSRGGGGARAERPRDGAAGGGGGTKKGGRRRPGER